MTGASGTRCTPGTTTFATGVAALGSRALGALVLLLALAGCGGGGGASGGPQTSPQPATAPVSAPAPGAAPGAPPADPPAADPALAAPPPTDPPDLREALRRHATQGEAFDLDVLVTGAASSCPAHLTLGAATERFIVRGVAVLAAADRLAWQNADCRWPGIDPSGYRYLTPAGDLVAELAQAGEWTVVETAWAVPTAIHPGDQGEIGTAVACADEACRVVRGTVTVRYRIDAAPAGGLTVTLVRRLVTPVDEAGSEQVDMYLLDPQGRLSWRRRELLDGGRAGVTYIRR